MITAFALTAPQVKKTVAAVKTSTPVYAELLDFYGGLFVIQEESKSRIRLEPIDIPDELQAVKARQKTPLIDVNEFVYDYSESSLLFRAICQLAEGANAELADSAKIISKKVGTKLALKDLFSGFLNDYEARFENFSAELGVKKQVLGFLTYNSLQPSLCLCADQLAVNINNSVPWSEGYCPVCGNGPILSFLQQEGRRKLVCSFCWQSWSSHRVYCPYCNCAQARHLHYFYNEEEKDARVDLCENCKKYIKTIDTRKIDRLIYPPLEHISRLHLDIKAQEMGFTPGIEPFI